MIVKLFTHTKHWEWVFFHLNFKISWYLLLLFWDLDPDLKVSKLGFKKWFLKNNLPFFIGISVSTR